MEPTLVLAAHGTRSAAGVAALRALADRVESSRPGLRVALCYLDVLDPRLDATLAAVAGPAVVVPALLSTGYHVLDDIPATVAARADLRVAPHLGPDRRLTAALRDRLAESGEPGTGPVALVAAGSSREAAADELRTAAGDLADATGRPVVPLTVADALPDATTVVATYLLADGWFAAQVRERAAAAGIAASAPLGNHPAVAELILARYDAAAG